MLEFCSISSLNSYWCPTSPDRDSAIPCWRAHSETVWNARSSPADVFAPNVAH